MSGGIYRPVSLLVLPKVNITPLDYASPGVYFEQLDADDKSARAAVRVLVDGFSEKQSGHLSLYTELADADGNIVARSSSRDKMTHNGFTAIADTIGVANPQLWDGRRSPSLYTLTVALADGDRIIDEVKQTVGFRTVTVDREKGLSLNGRPNNIRGVNRHQDRPGKGWAISEADHREDMELIKEIGANGIRLAHYPHAQYFYDLCDREGMLVWAEIPFVEQAPDTEEFAASTRSQLIELIRQNYNHPSIFCWSLFNELGGDGAEKIVTELNDIAHREDPHRDGEEMGHMQRQRSKAEQHAAQELRRDDEEFFGAENFQEGAPQEFDRPRPHDQRRPERDPGVGNPHILEHDGRDHVQHDERKPHRKIDRRHPGQRRSFFNCRNHRVFSGFRLGMHKDNKIFPHAIGIPGGYHLCIRKVIQFRAQDY